VFLLSALVILIFFSSRGWQSWDLEYRPLIPEGMPVLVDDDLRLEDGPAAPRPSVMVNRWLRELPASGAPAPSSWENYARAVKEWAEFLAGHGVVGLFTLGAVFLAVTGAEALYADLGHFGKRPIQLAWLCLVLPALAVNYLGQGALVLADAGTLKNPFFLLYPDWALLPMVALATAATVIASQAVITGAYSLTRQAIQLGLLPRLEIRHTSESQEGQIYMPRVNAVLLIGVLLLVGLFRSSSSLAL